MNTMSEPMAGWRVGGAAGAGSRARRTSDASRGRVNGSGGRHVERKHRLPDGDEQDINYATNLNVPGLVGDPLTGVGSLQ